MKKKPIDPIAIKQAIKDGQLIVFEKDNCIYIQDAPVGDCVKIYDKKINKCRDCKWLCGEKTSVGIACKHPDRPFYKWTSDIANMKAPSQLACKRFESKD